ncbi:MAG: large subunit ribosomal protein L24 [Parcubacteria group bacterium Greene0714_36]|nr:MAG: large subunit ribosomal protein L24 [Parcubacteria group bacterium Greene0714_36]
MMTGNDRGKTGRVLAAFPKEGRIVVDGINVKKKHVRPRKQGQKGELVQIPMPFSVSRAALVCGKCGKPTRVGWNRESARKRRVCKKCGSIA